MRSRHWLGRSKIACAETIPRCCLLAAAAERAIPEETAIALTYNRITHGATMATPSNLEDFAVGFSLCERVVDRPNEIESVEIVPTDDGIELRMWIIGAQSGIFRRAAPLPGGTDGVRFVRH